MRAKEWSFVTSQKKGRWICPTGFQNYLFFIINLSGNDHIWNLISKWAILNLWGYFQIIVHSKGLSLGYLLLDCWFNSSLLVAWNIMWVAVHWTCKRFVTEKKHYYYYITTVLGIVFTRTNKILTNKIQWWVSLTKVMISLVANFPFPK